MSRKDFVTSVNIKKAHNKTVVAENLELSPLIRKLLGDYLEKFYPRTLAKMEKLESEENALLFKKEIKKTVIKFRSLAENNAEHLLYKSKLCRSFCDTYGLSKFRGLVNDILDENE